MSEEDATDETLLSFRRHCNTSALIVSFFMNAPLLQNQTRKSAESEGNR